MAENTPLSYEERMKRAKDIFDSGEATPTQYKALTSAIEKKYGQAAVPVSPTGIDVAQTTPITDTVPLNGPALQAGGLAAESGAASAPSLPSTIDLTSTQTTSTGARPADMRAFDAGVEGQVKAMEEISKVEAENKNLDLVERQLIADKRAQDLGNELLLRDEEDAKTQAAQDEYVRKVDEASNMKIDSGRFFNSRSTGDKILAGFSILLGGLSSGLAGKPGAPNPAVDIIDKAIERDIREQESNAANASRAAELKGTVYQRVLAETGDKRVAREALRASTYEQLATKADIAAQRAGTPLIAQKSKLAAEALRANAAASKMAINKIATTKTVEQKAASPGKPLSVPSDTAIKDLSTKESTIQNFKEIQKNVKGQGKIKNAINQAQRALGVLNSADMADDAKVQAATNEYIKYITGAGVSNTEAVRLAKAFISRDMTNDSFQAILNGIIKQDEKEYLNLRKFYEGRADLPPVPSYITQVNAKRVGE